MTDTTTAQELRELADTLRTAANALADARRLALRSELDLADLADQLRSQEATTRCDADLVEQRARRLTD